jgi:hypothetical protein
LYKREGSPMQGDLIEHGEGHITYTRVLHPDELVEWYPRLASEGAMTCVEVSFEGDSRTLDADTHETGTYVSVPRRDGTMIGEGQGVLVTPQGEVVTWHGQGVGRTAEDGTTRWRGAIYYRSDSERFGRLNGAAGVYEYEVDRSGKTTAQVWEWK